MDAIRVMLVRERDTIKRIEASDPSVDPCGWPEVYLVPNDADIDTFIDRVISEAVYPVEVCQTTAAAWQGGLALAIRQPHE